MYFPAAFFATALFAAVLCPAANAGFHWDARPDDESRGGSAGCPLWNLACQTNFKGFHNWQDDCQWWQWYCKKESPPDIGE